LPIATILNGAHLTTTSASVSPAHGDNRVTFRGSGFGLAVQFLIVGLLTSLTFGLYLPFAFLQLRTWYLENIEIDGVRLHYQGDTVEYLREVALRFVLTIVTLGLYAPWAYDKVEEWIVAHTTWKGQPCRHEGDVLIGVFVWTAFVLIAVVTLFIGAAWGYVGLLLPFTRSQRVVGGLRWRFRGSAIEYFVFFLIHHVVLFALTLGLYAPFGFCAQERWVAARTSLRPAEEGRTFAMWMRGLAALVLAAPLIFGGAAILGVLPGVENARARAETVVNAVAAAASSLLHTKPDEAPAPAPPLGTPTGITAPAPPSTHLPPPLDGTTVPPETPPLGTPPPSGVTPTGWKPNLREVGGMWTWEARDGTTHIVTSPEAIPSDVKAAAGGATP
jgi:uncharacterized membrane protein YjgN (DUF898 family)